MNPSSPIPSGLYSILKVAILTFFGAFFGALTLTGVPTTLEQVKALVLPAFGVALAAEIYYLRSTLTKLLADALAAQEAAPPAPPAPAPSSTPAAPTPPAAARGFGALGALVAVLACGAVAGTIAILVSGCTPAQAQTATTITNGVFSADQAACMAANEGLIGDSSAVQEFESLCNLGAPLEQAIDTFIGDITKNPTAMARVAAERKAAGK
jgi:hypothetical protein